ncbi:MAG TPA: hypothetical protein VKA84_01440 [Gemmatimonadaceae bacterium]|nr:hypothetical protein [Gemmatimonadaceae bacterium]
MRHSNFPRTASILALTLLSALACARHSRSMFQPAPGAVRLVLQDSADAVLSAAERAISDEGIPIRLTDRGRRFVESRRIDIGTFSDRSSTEALPAAERMVIYRFFVRTDLGGTVLYGEAVTQPTGTEVRTMERMVSDEHPAHAVLSRMIDNVQKHLSDR